MATTYSDFLDVLDYELLQTKQGGDSAQADSFRFLPHTQALRVVNETIRELAMTSQDQFERELTYTFIRNTKTFTVPDGILRVIAYWDGTNECWHMLGDSSDLESTITSLSSDRITNSDGWAEGDKIKFKVIMFPPLVETGTWSAVSDSNGEGYIGTAYGDVAVLPIGSIVTITHGDFSEESVVIGQNETYTKMYLDYNDSYSVITVSNAAARNINFPEAYTRLLVLEIKRKAWSRKNKAISSYEFSELMGLKRKWENEVSPVLHRATISFEGTGIGR